MRNREIITSKRYISLLMITLVALLSPPGPLVTAIQMRGKDVINPDAIDDIINDVDGL